MGRREDHERNGFTPFQLRNAEPVIRRTPFPTNTEPVEVRLYVAAITLRCITPFIR